MLKLGQMDRHLPEFTISRPEVTELRLGYVRLLDAAPLIVAHSMGLFEAAGLNVVLSREPGWATVRDKIAFGALDISQALSPMPFVMQLGLGVARCEVITAMVLNCNGNAITLSQQLAAEGVTDGDSLRRYIKSGYRPRKLVLGVVSLYSSHHFMLCRWLEQHQINPQEDVIITVLPPEQMFRNLLSTNIDGFCVGEPWNSLAVAEGGGWCPAISEQIVSGYPEKVLATTEDFYAERGEEYLRMIEVLHQACSWCDSEAQRAEILAILSKPQYLDCAEPVLAQAFAAAFPLGAGRTAAGPLLRFYGQTVNRPDQPRAQQVLRDLNRFMPHPNFKKLPQGFAARVYRTDLYDQAVKSILASTDN